MVTWKDFIEEMKRQGVTDDTEVDFLDFSNGRQLHMQVTFATPLYGPDDLEIVADIEAIKTDTGLDIEGSIEAFFPVQDPDVVGFTVYVMGEDMELHKVPAIPQLQIPNIGPEDTHIFAMQLHDVERFVEMHDYIDDKKAKRSHLTVLK